MIEKNFEKSIGNTPLRELKNIQKEFGLNCKIFAKLENENPLGSAKDRPAKFMVDDAEKKGLLKPGGTIIEPTSGNTGIGLAAIGTSRGYRVIIVMPDTMSVERQDIIKSYGAEVVLTEGKKGITASVAKAKELAGQIDGSYIPNQFENMANPKAHYQTTGPEIWDDTKGKIDFLVATFGTGGTISGTGKFLKEKNPKIKVIGIEPETSPLATKGYAGPHLIQGIGASFIPKTMDLDLCDEILTVDNERPFELGKLLRKKEEISVGISSGAALAGALQIAKRSENAGKNIVAIFPDSGDRYYSTPLFEE